MFHLEATENPGALIKDTQENRMKVGIAIKPGTTVEYLVPWANQIDIALVMTVEPGFGGQKFMEDMMPKVKRSIWFRSKVFCCVYSFSKHVLGCLYVWAACMFMPCSEGREMGVPTYHWNMG